MIKKHRSQDTIMFRIEMPTKKKFKSLCAKKKTPESSFLRKYIEKVVREGKIDGL